MTRSRSSSRLAALGVAALLVGSLPATAGAEEEEGRAR